jgi:hypothetical protein
MGMTRTRWPWLVAGALLLSARPSGSAPADDGAPSGMVAFFAAGTGCPAGWMAATEAAGRIVVAATDSNVIGRRIGVPLLDQEDRAHTHTFTATTTIAVKNVAAFDGGNNQAAQAGTLMSGGTMAEARTGLPFVQLVVCKKP